MVTMLPIYLRNVGVNMMLVRRAARLCGGKKNKNHNFLLFRIDHYFLSKQIFITIIARNKRTGPKGYSSAVCKIGTSTLKED